MPERGDARAVRARDDMRPVVLSRCAEPRAADVADGIDLALVRPVNLDRSESSACLVERVDDDVPVGEASCEAAVIERGKWSRDADAEQRGHRARLRPFAEALRE